MNYVIHILELWVVTVVIFGLIVYLETRRK